MASGPGGVIAAVEPGSLGEAIGLQASDRLMSINEHRLRDIIDVQFYSAEEKLRLVVEREGKPIRIEVERAYDEALGLSFAHPTFDVGIRRCVNNCDFCFVKQNAPGMRRSLYIKDDDYRHSFLFGNFVTLTNLTEEDWARLEEQRLSPLYVSVHATDLALRRHILARESAPDVMDQLRRLADLAIEVHIQVVLVPGVNDGEHLLRTLADLTSLYQEPVASVGIVPVGLTRFHRGSCRTHTSDESRMVLSQLTLSQAMNRERWGSGFVYPSDEWYLMTGWEIPSAPEYDGFPQVENGIGMVRRLLDEANMLTADPRAYLPTANLTSRAVTPGGAPAPGPARQASGLSSATLVCGTLIAPLMARIVGELNLLTGADLRLVPVVNRFFGVVTTVSGLLTGSDVVAALQGKSLDCNLQQAQDVAQERPLGDAVLLPRAMFTGRYGAGSAPAGITLDGMSLADIAARLDVRVELAGTLAEVLDAIG